MIRVAAACAVMVFGGGTLAAATGTVEASHSILSAPVDTATVQGVSVDDAPASGAILHAPPGTSVLAVSAGTLAHPDATRTEVRGSGDDTGLDVVYTMLAGATAMPSVQRGDIVGTMPSPPAVVTIRVVLDGRALDAAALLRTALRGGGDDTVGAWTHPVENAVVTQPFGCTPYAMEPVDRSCATGHIHSGIDLAVPRGTPVHAALDGIAHVHVSATGYGLHVVVDHGSGLSTLYAHLDAVTVQDGDAVAAGDVIGLVGSTGNSTGPHLHFEVRRDGIAEDPTLDVALP